MNPKSQSILPIGSMEVVHGYHKNLNHSCIGTFFPSRKKKSLGLRRINFQILILSTPLRTRKCFGFHVDPWPSWPPFEGAILLKIFHAGEPRKCDATKKNV